MWFECRLKYQKIDENGKEKKVSELYLVEAVTFTDAESRINKEIEAYISGEFNVVNIKIANYSEIIPYEGGDKWFKSKVVFTSLDEEKGKERKTNAYMLVQAENLKEAFENLDKAMEGTISDYTIAAIAESPIMDLFPYFSENNQEHIPNNLTPVSEIDNED